MKLNKSKISGCYEIICNCFEDERGCFVKTLHKPAFEELGLQARFLEEYYSISKKGVIRGMHFQTPPEDHVKLVYCTTGAVLDVVVDIRKNSSTYGQYAAFNLSLEKNNMVYIPKGMAHGFCVLSDTATMIYKVSTIYSPEHDGGILWNSIGVDWPASRPVVSQRDQGLESLQNFNSPFEGER